MFRKIARWFGLAVGAITVAGLVILVVWVCLAGVEPTKEQIRLCALNAGSWTDLLVGQFSSRPTVNEYQIYNHILGEYIDGGLFGSAQMIAIARETEWDPNYRESFPALVSYLTQDLSNVPLDDVVRDFCRKNSDRALHRRKFKLSRSHRLVPLKRFQALLDAPGGWDNFEATYPDTWSLQVFSRVGFNDDRTVALVYFSEYARGGGSGWYVLYRKTNGRWREVGHRMRWIS